MNDDDGGEIHSLFPVRGRVLGKTKRRVGINVNKRRREIRHELDKSLLEQAHRYVLFNIEELNKDRQTHYDMLKGRHKGTLLGRQPNELQKLHCKEFTTWFRNKDRRSEEEGDAIKEEEEVDASVKEEEIMAKRNSKRKRTIRSPPASTVITGNNVPLTAQTQESSIPKKTRKGTEMHYLWGMAAGEKLPIELDENGCPINENSGDYTRFLGTVARRSYLCPLSYLRWDHIPKEKLDSIWDDEIEPRFHFSPVEYCSNIKEWSIEEVNDKWRLWKCNLKRKHFDFSKSDDANVEVIKNQEPDRVDADQYRILVNHWLSNTGKKISETNKANIGKYKDPHCAGPKAFRQIALELAEKNEGVKPSRGVLYRHTRKNKKSEYVNTIAEEYGNELENVMAKKCSMREARKKAREENTEHVEDITSSDEEMTWDNDDYDEVRGKSKRTRPNCVGHLHISVRKAKTGLHVEQSSNDMIAKLAKQAKQIKDMEKRQVARMDEMKKKHAEEVEQLHNKYDGDIEKMQKAMDARDDFA
ncbi:hypothetical protein ACFE04_013298 [Oxalis oulophora]